MSNNLNKYYKNGSSYEPRMQAVEQQVSQFIAGEVGKTVYFPTWYTPPHLLYIKPNGGLYSKTTYAALWAAFSGSAITSTEYDATVASSPVSACSRYADIDADTFRVPTVGTGGFMRSVGANGEMPIGSEDGGFGSQVEEHKHATPLLWYTVGNTNVHTMPDDDLWGSIDSPDGGRYEYSNGSGSSDTNSAMRPMLTSPDTYDNSGETSPQGTYVQPYIFTGIVVSNLPEPTSADLAQIGVNTDAITALQEGGGSSGVTGIGTSGLVEIWSGGDAEETIQCPEGWDTYTMLTLTATNGKYVHSNTYPISVLLANPDKYYVGMKHSATGTRGAYLTGFTATTCEMIWVIADGYTITHVHCIK